MIMLEYYMTYRTLTTLVIGGEYVTVLSNKGRGFEGVLEAAFEFKESKDKKFILISAALMYDAEWDYLVDNECCSLVLE